MFCRFLLLWVWGLRVLRQKCCLAVVLLLFLGFTGCASADVAGDSSLTGDRGRDLTVVQEGFEKRVLTPLDAGLHGQFSDQDVQALDEQSPELVGQHVRGLIAGYAGLGLEQVELGKQVAGRARAVYYPSGHSRYAPEFAVADAGSQGADSFSFYTCLDLSKVTVDKRSLMSVLSANDGQSYSAAEVFKIDVVAGQDGSYRLDLDPDFSRGFASCPS